MGERLVVQFARGSTRQRDGYEHQPRAPPRTRRTQYRMTITGLPIETSWQDLKDFARNAGLDVVYSEITRERDPGGLGVGYVRTHMVQTHNTDNRRYVEYETAQDLKTAIEKLDGADFKGSAVHCIDDVSDKYLRV